jgi:hypothetical protein
MKNKINMTPELNPIQKQMFAMTKLFLEKNSNHTVVIKTTVDKIKILTFNFKRTNIGEFIDKIIEYKTGVICFYFNSSNKGSKNIIDIVDNYQNKVEFIYSYEDDVVSFTPMNIKRNSEYTEQIFDLFTEAEFLINISFDDFIIDSDFIKK